MICPAIPPNGTAGTDKNAKLSIAPKFKEIKRFCGQHLPKNGAKLWAKSRYGGGYAFPHKKAVPKRPQAFRNCNTKYSFRSLCPKCNDDDRRQRRKQGGVVGAAASKTRVPPKARCGCWVPQPDSGGHSKSFYLPASSTASTAFWTWRRFSASSKISSACCSNRAVEISSPRWAGRQCSTSALGFAFSSRRPVS